MLTENDWQALWLTVRLAGIVTLVLLLIGTPIAWWLARTKTWWKGPIAAVVALPLVLPPSVLGFYLQAHRLAAVMLAFSFVVLLALYAWRPRPNKGS